MKWLIAGESSTFAVALLGIFLASVMKELNLGKANYDGSGIARAI
jgi:hypothetical protein